MQGACIIQYMHSAYSAMLPHGMSCDVIAHVTKAHTLEPGLLCMLAELGRTAAESSEGSLKVCMLTVSALWMLLSFAGGLPLATSRPPEPEGCESCCCTRSPCDAAVHQRASNFASHAGLAVGSFVCPVWWMTPHSTRRSRGKGARQHAEVTTTLTKYDGSRIVWEAAPHCNAGQGQEALAAGKNRSRDLGVGAEWVANPGGSAAPVTSHESGGDSWWT